MKTHKSIQPMHESLKNVPNRILEVALGALAQANTHAVYYDPGREYWDQMAVLNTAMAGELFLKAIIAKEHPLLIFRDLFRLDDERSEEMDLERIIEKGLTYNFEHLPKLLWVATGERLPDINSFEKIRKVRNSIQHFCAPEEVNFRHLSLEFIYKNLDPLIHKHFGLCAIEYHEETSVNYDYVANCVIAQELFFSIPEGFCVTEVDLNETLSQTSTSYREEMIKRLSTAGFSLT